MSIGDSMGATALTPAGDNPISRIDYGLSLKVVGESNYIPHDSGFVYTYRFKREATWPARLNYNYMHVQCFGTRRRYIDGELVEELSDRTWVGNQNFINGSIDSWEFRGAYDCISGDKNSGTYSEYIYNGDIEITLETSVRNFDLTFNSNGGQGGETVSLYEGQTYKNNRQAIPTRTGYRWLGWARQTVGAIDYPRKHNGGGGNVIEFGPMPGYDVTLYARWHQWTYRPLTQNGVIIHKRDDGKILRDGDG
jgi:hypothetical protein